MLEQLLLLNNDLIWFPEKGIGYYPVKDFPYNQSYFQKYKKYSHTPMGQKINNTRINLVNRHYLGKIIDVGIGCGQFVSQRKNTFGFDVHGVAIIWLKNQELFADLYSEKFEAITFWDSLEHIENPDKAINQAKKWVFVSIPIFRNLDHLLGSKHFRKDEHYWYFTHQGIINYFFNLGFGLIEYNTCESRLGREDIISYAFKRMI